MNVCASFLIALALVPTVVPVASAADLSAPPALPQPAAPSVHSFDLVGGGSMELACLGPNFFDCSFAIAATAKHCAEVPVIPDICVNAWVGVGGGLSSLAATGGTAFAEANTRAGACSWSGQSGGCASIWVTLSSSCAGATVIAEGMVGIAGLGGIVAPVARAEANGCNLLSTAEEAPTPEEVVADASAAVRALSPSLAAAFDDAIARAGGEGVTSVR